MSAVNGGGSAFPVVADNGLGHVSAGMTLRAWLAGQALVGLLSGRYQGSTEYNLSEVPREATAIADAMIAALEQGA